MLGLNCILIQTRLYSIDIDQTTTFFSNAFDLSQWIQSHEPPDATFLLVTDNIEEQEWFPYLLRRTPAVSFFGAEWNGSYSNQYSLYQGQASCYQVKSWPCLQSLIGKPDIAAGLLVIHMDAQPDSIYASLKRDPGWRMLYSNGVYSVWERSTASLD